MQTQEAIDLLYTKLPEYITTYMKADINKRGFFKCPFGTHSDSSPSCHVNPRNTKVVKCFGCNKSTNIIGLAHYVEGFPISGPDFWRVTLYELCRRFEIDYTPEELKPEEKEKYIKLRAYQDAVNIITEYNNDKESLVYKYITERKWDEDILNSIQLGVVENYDSYINQMRDLGWDDAYLTSCDLNNRALFNPNNLIFAICDAHGRPIAFTCRNTAYNPEDKDNIKWINSENSSIYHKGDVFYNLHNAKKACPPQPLWIVEGYGDCAYLYHLGFRNIVALGSTAFTDDEYTSHVNVLKKNKINDIVICLDNDKGGKMGIERSLEKLSKHNDFKIRICAIPEYDDPESFVRAKGIEEFKKLPLLTPFEFKLGQYPHDVEASAIAKEMINFICLEKNTIDHWTMADILWKRTAIPVNVIMSAVQNQLNMHGVKELRKFQEFKRNFMRETGRIDDIKEFECKLEQDLAMLHNISHEPQLNKSPIETYNRRLTEMENRFFTEKYPAFSLGKFKLMDINLEGIPKKAALIGLAGAPNIGKTSFLRALALEMIYSNPNIFLIFMSIDDNLEKVVAGTISLITNLKMNEISRASQKLANNKGRLNLCKIGWKKFYGLTDKFVIKDSVEGNTLNALESHIQTYKNLYPEKDIVVFFDNFHKLGDLSVGTKDTQSKFRDSSGIMKNVCNKFNVPIITTLELRKGDQSKSNGRPTLQDVKESIDIEYDCDAVWLMYQDMHVNRMNSNLVIDENIDGVLNRVPIIELEVAKNKLGEFKNFLYYKFYTNKSKFEEIHPDEVAFIENSNKDQRRNSSNDRLETTQPTTTVYEQGAFEFITNEKKTEDTPQPNDKKVDVDEFQIGEKL